MGIIRKKNFYGRIAGRYGRHKRLLRLRKVEERGHDGVHRIDEFSETRRLAPDKYGAKVIVDVRLREAAPDCLDAIG